MLWGVSGEQAGLGPAMSLAKQQFTYFPGVPSGLQAAQASCHASREGVKLPLGRKSASRTYYYTHTFGN